LTHQTARLAAIRGFSAARQMIDIVYVILKQNYPECCTPHDDDRHEFREVPKSHSAYHPQELYCRHNQTVGKVATQSDLRGTME
jgi:hypothetical protein